jgi:hypothetical protein
MEDHWGPIMKQLGYKLSSEMENETVVTHATQ